VEHQRLRALTPKTDGATNASTPELTRLADQPADRVRLLHRCHFHHIAALTAGCVRQTAAHTMRGTLTGAELEQCWHHSRAHRFFSALVR
jgi:hypothetical protein